ncbi:hypothetical protein IP76_21325 [Rhizobium sp. AAP43]|nr:hypothetical protein IP76_21325 [Rhizobium sp. AAP43]
MPVTFLENEASNAKLCPGCKSRKDLRCPDRENVAEELSGDNSQGAVGTATDKEADGDNHQEANDSNDDGDF